ncbi:MAG: hypothetical protein Q4E67_03835 [Planctomycetia bacterium]|nr:hypothetical protein [Planctomycetia bacterium]
MNIRQFLQHYGIMENPFADEEASTDPVFKGFGIDHAYHPAWDKIFGTPAEPATSVVFGEKGSGKTAMRLQMVRKLSQYNSEHPDRRIFIIPYDDFNPFIDRFREKQPFWRKKIEKALHEWKVWDHIDAILSLGVTQLVDRILQVEHVSYPAVPGREELPVEKLEASQKRDLLLLAMLYDQSNVENRFDRWKKLAKKLKFRCWPSWLPLVGGGIWSVATAYLWFRYFSHVGWWGGLAVLAGWLPWVWNFSRAWWRMWKLRKGMRTLEHSPRPLRQILQTVPGRELADQPMPWVENSDARYEWLSKFQAVLKTLGFSGIFVLVDRVDEPYQINGVPQRMRDFAWSLLDNKLLKHPGIGFKLLLPGELYSFVLRETDEFRQRARLDKQNTISSFQWTGQSLYDLANTRIAGCVPSNEEGKIPELEDFFEPGVSREFLVNSLQSIAVPRRLFKFLYQVIVNHTNMHTENAPVWQISQATFLSTLADFQKNG